MRVRIDSTHTHTQYTYNDGLNASVCVRAAFAKGFNGERRVNTNTRHHIVWTSVFFFFFLMTVYPHRHTQHWYRTLALDSHGQQNVEYGFISFFMTYKNQLQHLIRSIHVGNTITYIIIIHLVNCIRSRYYIYILYRYTICFICISECSAETLESLVKSLKIKIKIENNFWTIIYTTQTRGISCTVSLHNNTINVYYL